MKPGLEVEQMTLKESLMQCICPAFGLRSEKSEITFTWLQQKTIYCIFLYIFFCCLKELWIVPYNCTKVHTLNLRHT